MFARKLSLLLFSFAALWAPAPVSGWGEAAHFMLTRAAVDRVPGPLGEFFRRHRDFVVCYSPLPDGWWGSVELLNQLPPGLENPAGENGHREQERHHFAEDEEAYKPAVDPRQGGVRPLDRAAARELFEKYVAQEGQAALERFKRENRWYQGGLAELPEAMCNKAGDLPWVIEERLAEMTAAMKAGQWARALFLASILSHYVGDANVPLHATVNFNGQFHPNPKVRGIHSRWESKMFGKNKADYARYLKERNAAEPPQSPKQAQGTREHIFGMVAETGSKVDNLLRVDDECLDQFAGHSSDNGERSRGEDPRVYTPEYYAELYKRLGPEGKEQLWKSVDRTVHYWLTAWERAGRPAPPSGAVQTPPLVYIDFKNGRVVPYRPSEHTN